MPAKIKTGLDLVEKDWPAHLADARVGLLVHPASVNSALEHAVDIFSRSRRSELRCLFGPQHGIRGETQDNMVEWEGFEDPRTGLRVFSLYGTRRRPDTQMMKGVDVMVIDLQDVGSRYYTFIWTLALVMESCREEKKAVVVLDRPNPIGGHIIEGPILQPDFKSFVGLHSLPVRHGMTVGEIALYFKEFFYPGVDLYVIQMKDWKRTMWFDDTHLPWVLPSPNMPTLDTAAVYPGMCLLEGTELSEGRGTTRPFETFGAPYIDPFVLVKKLKEEKMPGTELRPLYFMPTFQKHAGKFCGGAQIHITDREKFKPFRTAVAIIRAILELYPKEFLWKSPPYEYEFHKMPFDILAGGDRLRKEIEAGKPVREMEGWWNTELSGFDKKIRKEFLLYP
jgi:uncharacterized protein YbbC (DUF1343 family)